MQTPLRAYRMRLVFSTKKKREKRQRRKKRVENEPEPTDKRRRRPKKRAEDKPRPTATDQRAVLRRWFAGARWAYNKAVGALNGGMPIDAVYGHVFGNRLNPAADKPTDVPFSFMRDAELDAEKAYKSNIAKQNAQRRRGEPVQAFTLKERTPQDETEILQLSAAFYREELKQDGTPRVAIRSVVSITAAERPIPPGRDRPARRRHADLQLAHGFPGTLRIIDSERIIGRLVADNGLVHGGVLQWCRSRRHGNGFYLIVRLPVEIPPPRAMAMAMPPRVVSLDPCARKFQVWYDPADGSSGELLAGVKGSRNRRRGRRDPWRDVVDEIDVRTDTRAKRHRRRGADRQPWGIASADGQPAPPDPRGAYIASVWATGRKARAERERLEAAGAIGAPERDPTHQAWLRGRLRKFLRERQYAHRREAARVTDWMEHGHYNAIQFLTERWDVIVASSVRFSELMSKLAASTNRHLSCWSRAGSNRQRAIVGRRHYKFHRRLESAAAARGVVVRRTPEYGTSRTCGRCGAWNAGLGGDETLRCGGCGWVIDRDINGARNNLLCALTRGLLPAQ